ncbi:MAG: FG-GAP repeat domain-containing protein [Isosphaeraceae bacterium]
MLSDPQGQVLVQSDGLSPANPDDSIDEHLAPGTYALDVESSGTAGAYTLTTTLTPATAPYQSLTTTSSNPYGAMAIGDFDGDSIPDLATPDGVYKGLGDGTFATQPSASLDLPPLPCGDAITAMIAGDFTGTGKLDLAVAYGDLIGGVPAAGGVYVLLGNGDGTFQKPVPYAAGVNPSALVAGDFTGDGHLDLAVADKGDDTPRYNRPGGVSILIGNGDGTFLQPAGQYDIGFNTAPQSLAAGYFTGNGILDLAVANSDRASNSVTILIGDGQGGFEAKSPSIPVGTTPYSLVAGDFTGNDILDLAVANAGSDNLSILIGNGDGTFQDETLPIPVGETPQSLVAGEFTPDGKLDLALANVGSGEVSVLLGNGNGTFQAARNVTVGAGLTAVAAADFNQDGRLDLAVANNSTNQVSFLLGNGDGAFQTPATAVGDQPLSVAAGDFNGDGYVDLATADTSSDDVSILLGNGDGTFQAAAQIPLPGFSPTAIVTEDFNGDGRLDLAVAGFSQTNGSLVAVLLGNGDGTFQPPTYYPVGNDPVSLVAAELSGNGHYDLATANIGSNNVSILMGNGDGTFETAQQYPVGDAPDSLVAGTFTGAGSLDLAVAYEGDLDPYTGQYIDGGVSILIGDGHGGFQPSAEHPESNDAPLALAAGNFTGLGELDDLAVLAGATSDVTILVSNGDGTFRQEAQPIPVGNNADALVAGEFANGQVDLAVASKGNLEPTTGQYSGGGVTILIGDGRGGFQEGALLPAGTAPYSLVVDDFNGDGNLDLAVANSGSNDVSVLLGNGAGGFVPAGQSATAPHATPLVVDVNGDGTADVLVVDGAGQILYRQGIPRQPGTFEPPVIVNPSPNAPNPYASRGIAWVPDTIDGPLLASVDANNDAVSLFAFKAGSFVLVGSLPTGQLPAQIVAADLSGDGWDDLVVRNAADGTLWVYYNLNDPDGPGRRFDGPVNSGMLAFDSLVTIPVGLGVSDVQAIDTTGNGRLDLVLTNSSSGQVSTLLNLGQGAFAAPIPYRAGTGLSQVDAASSAAASLEATAGVAGGPLEPGGPADLAAINPGTNTLDILAGLGGGQFANPSTIDTESPAQAVVMADFRHNGIMDLAVLTSGTLFIYFGNGQGAFSLQASYAVGPDSTGLTAADVNHDGNLDLLVGDSLGDVLVLLGNGTGRFQPYHEADQAIELAVADLTGTGREDIIYADQSLDQVVVDFGAGNSQLVADKAQGLLDPGAVELARLAGPDYPSDLIVANCGSNTVLIYPGEGDGRFGPAINGGHGYFVGTNPVGITTSDLTGDGKLDLIIADKGSNQVSILFNDSQGGVFSFEPGPRLNSDGIGPVSTAVGTYTGSPYPDILVTNSLSNDVVLLPGVGQGFFDDRNPRIYSVGIGPELIIPGDFNGQPGLITVNEGSNDLTLLSSLDDANPTTSTIPSGGVEPDTAFAFGVGDGFDDVVVGNSGDDTLALFAGGPGGLSLLSTTSEPSLPDLTALAFSALTAGQVLFYAATAGQEAAQFLALDLNAALTSVSATVIQLVAPDEFSLPLLPSFWTLTIAPSAGDPTLALDETAAPGPAALAAGLGVSFGQGLSAQTEHAGAGPDQPESSGEPGADALAALPGTNSSWEHFFLGLDEVLERLTRGPMDTSGARDAASLGDPSDAQPEAARAVRDGPTSWRLPPVPVRIQAAMRAISRTFPARQCRSKPPRQSSRRSGRKRARPAGPEVSRSYLRSNLLAAARGSWVFPIRFFDPDR